MIKSTIAFLLIWLSMPLAAAAQVVHIPDPNLRTAVEAALGKAPGDQITADEMAVLTRLKETKANISDLTGLEHAVNLGQLILGYGDVDAVPTDTNNNTVSNLTPLEGLTKLNSLILGDNNISDISPLSGLPWLETLSLEVNNISDISPLSGLMYLLRLNLWDNDISDISPLSGLTNLIQLGLWDNNISDISALSGLTDLVWLDLSGNSISDISALTGLTSNPTILSLGENNISDISPLITNTEVDSGDRVDLRGNPLSYQSIHQLIPILQSREVEVKFDMRASTSLVKISGSEKGVVGLSLPNPFVFEVRDQYGFAFEGVPVTFVVTAGGGTLSVTSATTGSNGRAESTLTLGPNPGLNTVEVAAPGIQQIRTVTAIAELPIVSYDVNRDDVVNILDLVLVASVLGEEGADLAADVNGDGVVNILDLVVVAGAFEGAAAPSAHVSETISTADIREWLHNARGLERKDAMTAQGIVVLEQLLVALKPTETKLLANYPNPFNPETWIPYRLAEDASVRLTIYDAGGRVVRVLDVGHQPASFYESRSNAIYWDGRNESGEQVASGVYFYHLAAGDFAATRKMLIRK